MRTRQPMRIIERSTLHDSRARAHWPRACGSGGHRDFAAAPGAVLTRNPSPHPHAQNRLRIGERNAFDLRALFELAQQFLSLQSGRTGRHPSDPHHLRFAQPRALSLKVSDEFTVPLCRGHHRQLHQTGNELAWWKNLNIDSLQIAKGLWEQTHLNAAPVVTHPPEIQTSTTKS